MALPFWWRKVSFLSLFQVLDLESPHERKPLGTDGPANDSVGPPSPNAAEDVQALGEILRVAKLAPANEKDHLKVFKPKGWVPAPVVGINLNRIPTGQSGPYCKLRPTRVPYF